jgi:hypothetical protein
MAKIIGYTDVTGTELAVLDGVTPGTVLASKAVVVDSNKDAAALRNLTVTNLDAGASGTAGTVEVFPSTASKGKFKIAVADQTGDTLVTHQVAAMGQASVITLPDPGAAAASYALTEGTQTLNGTKTFGAALRTSANVGAAGTGFTAVEYGDGALHKTVLTASTTLPAIAGGAALSVGKLAYTFPAGAIVVHAAYMSIGITQSQGNITADTPDVGLGTVIAAGANALISDTGSAENILTGQTAANCSGTATVALVVNQVLAIAAGGAHTVYLNVADDWAASGDAAAAVAGTIVLEWSFIA